jgi:hypothetical protein
MNIFKTVVTLSAAASVAVTLGSTAYAGGFIGNAINKVVPGAGKKLDDWHKKAGKPLDHAANVAAGVAVNTVAPGAGAPTTAVLEARTNRH